MSATISIAMSGDSHGWVVAVIPSPDRYVMAASLLVGSVRRDGGNGECKAWLWPEAGGAIRYVHHCDMVRAPDAGRLRDKLQKRADKDGLWWERAEAAA